MCLGELDSKDIKMEVIDKEMANDPVAIKFEGFPHFLEDEMDISGDLELEYEDNLDINAKKKFKTNKKLNKKQDKDCRELDGSREDMDSVPKRKYKARPYVANQIGNLVCDCKEKPSFKNEKARKKHLRDIHSDLPKFHCTLPNCNQVFGKKNTLEKHLEVFHGHQCNECKNGYKDQNTLKNHRCPNVQKTSDPDTVSGFFCDQCGKRLANAHSLKEHLEIHKDIKWPCDECPKVFHRELNLKHHKKMCHSNQVFLCPVGLIKEFCISATKYLFSFDLY